MSNLMSSGEWYPSFYCSVCGQHHMVNACSVGYQPYSQSYDNDGKTLNELVDDVIGKEITTDDIINWSKHPKEHDKNWVIDYIINWSKHLKEHDKNWVIDYRPKKETLVVNLFSGPGAGKSTTCSGIFFDLKNLQVNCEMAHEYAKDLIWEQRTHTFENQIYLFAKQHHRIFRLLNKVNVVITDCPLLLTPVYDKQHRPTFEKLVVEEHKKMWTYNVFLKRKKQYNPKGRNQTEDEAREIDRQVLDVLDRNNECYEVFDASPEGKDAIVKKIMMLINK